MHYGEGVCNIVSDPRDFYAENIRSSYRVPVVYVDSRRCGHVG